MIPTDAVGVRLQGLTKRFAHRVKGEVHAARDVSLDVAPGEFLTLLGPSGCGKTTTLRMVAGFETPDEGRIHFGDQDVTALPANHRGIGFVFQNYALFPHLTVFDNVAYGLRVRQHPQHEVARAVTEVLALVGLTGYEQQFPAQLSGGEQQRVALARAIVIRPRVLLFDEPLSNLDAKLRVQMRSEIRALQRRLAITTLYVTHDQEEAMAVSDRIAVMHQGRVVQQGSAEALYHRPESLFVAQFIGRVNVVPGRIVGRDGDGGRVQALDTTFEVREMPAHATPGADVQLLLRPEALSLQRPTGASGEIAVTVAARTFLGEKVDYVVQRDDVTLQVVCIATGEDALPAPGDAVALHVRPAAVTVLRASPQGSER